MPHRIDEHENFSRLTSGAIKVLDEEGVPGLSWTAVARASEMSVGAVRHRCEMSRDRLLRLVVIALCRAREQRPRTAGLLPYLGSTPLQYAVGLLLRTEWDRCDVRVTAMLSGEPSVPEEARRLLEGLERGHRRWCDTVAGDDPAAAALVHAVTTGLELATARREKPLLIETAERVLHQVLAPFEHANLSPTDPDLA